MSNICTLQDIKTNKKNEELVAKINELSDHVNYLFRFLIGAPE